VPAAFVTAPELDDAEPPPLRRLPACCARGRGGRRVARLSLELVDRLAPCRDALAVRLPELRADFEPPLDLEAPEELLRLLGDVAVSAI